MGFRLNQKTVEAVSSFYKLPEEQVRSLALQYGFVPRRLDDDRIEVRDRFYTPIPLPTGGEELVVFEWDSVEYVDEGRKMKLPSQLKPNVAKTICDQLGITQAQLEEAQANILLVPQETEEGYVFDAAYLLMVPVRGHIEQVVVTRDDLVEEEDGK